MKVPDEVKRLVHAGKEKRIYAIQALRRITGLGLAEAKELVEIIATGGEVEIAIPERVFPSDESPEQRFRRQIEAISKEGRDCVLNEEGIRKVLDFLAIDEDLIEVAGGTYCRCKGVLVATPKRLLFLNDEIVEGPNAQEFPFENICLIHHMPGQFGSSIRIFLSDYTRAEFVGMTKLEAERFAACIKSYGESWRIGLKHAWDYDALEYLEALYANGVITREELERDKRKILARIGRQRKSHNGRKSRPS